MRGSHDRPSPGRIRLRSLEVFEAAARHGGFTAAGGELGITQSAVSRQVADLEAELGVALFTRHGARVAITPAGRTLADRLARAFGEARAAVREAARADGVVTLSMLPSVAARWFAPRLGRFVAAHPTIDLRIAASRHLVDFAAEGIDAAIRYGRGSWPGLEARMLAQETVSPVCAPSLRDRLALAAPTDLLQASLLHGDLPEDWRAWFAAVGHDGPVPDGPRLGDDAAILQAAVEGHGVALGRSRLVADDLAAGRLVAPFGPALEASHAYWFVRPQERKPNAALRAVETWIALEFAAARC